MCFIGIHALDDSTVSVLILQKNVFLQLMSRDFLIGSQSKAVGKILMGTYNNNTGEFITVGPNFITVSYVLKCYITWLLLHFSIE